MALAPTRSRWAPEPVAALGKVQLAAAQPLQIQRHHTPASQADASLLLVFDGLSGASGVAVHVEDSRQGTPVSRRFVEQCRDLQAGEDLDQELLEAVSAVILRWADLTVLKRGFHPFLWPAAVDDVPEELCADVIRLGRPIFGTGGEGRQFWGSRQEVFVKQVVKQPRLQGFLFQEGE